MKIVSLIQKYYYLFSRKHVLKHETVWIVLFKNNFDGRSNKLSMVALHHWFSLDIHVVFQTIIFRLIISYFKHFFPKGERCTWSTSRWLLSSKEYPVGEYKRPVYDGRRKSSWYDKRIITIKCHVMINEDKLKWNTNK